MNNLNKEKVDKVGSAMWKAAMKNKETLQIYKSQKFKISEIEWYDALKAKLMVESRKDALQLNWRNRHTQENAQCICGYENEMYRFVNNTQIPEKSVDFAQQPYIENRS